LLFCPATGRMVLRPPSLRARSTGVAAGPSVRVPQRPSASPSMPCCASAAPPPPSARCSSCAPLAWTRRLYGWTTEPYVQAYSLLLRAMFMGSGSPMCMWFVACSALGGLGVFAKEYIRAGTCVMEQGGYMDFDKVLRKGAAPLTHARSAADTSGGVRDGGPWMRWMQPQFTAEERAAQLLLPPLLRTRVFIDVNAIDIPGLPDDKGQSSLFFFLLLSFLPICPSLHPVSAFPCCYPPRLVLVWYQRPSSSTIWRSRSWHSSSTRLRRTKSISRPK